MILLLFSIAILIPIQFSITQSYLTLDHKPTLAQPENVLRVGVSSPIVTGNWDYVTTDGYNVLEYYKKNALEPLLWLPDDSSDPESHLATAWEYEYWPEEFNSLGFINRGGVKAVSITLRDGVKFHDGSDWNASVAKWNIDRLYIITGNLTGNANGIYDQRNTANIWDPESDWNKFYTSNWNLSEFDAPDRSYPANEPQVSDYGYYFMGDPAIPANKLFNPNPYGGWDAVVQNFRHWAPFDQVPMVRWVNVTESKQSGGKIRIEFNSWDLYNIQDQVWTPQISMQAYEDDYTETGIYGYANGNDMIGTGPYKYGEHDELADWGYMIKNEDYWNRTDLEADGWFDADRVEFIQFDPGDLGKDAQNAALLTHAIDYVFDSMTMPVDYAAIMANPKINYVKYSFNDYITQITLNSINETWWTGEPSANFSWVDINSLYTAEQGDPAANGIPRPLRKALNFAFDYNTLLQIDLNDRAVRAGGMLGIESVYYNSSLPFADYNLTYAREVLLNAESDIYSLTDPVWPINFTKLLSDRGLTASSSDAAWKLTANTNPIFTINFYWDDQHQELADQFELACNLLGVAIVQDADNKVPAGTSVWSHTVSSYWTKNFDGVHSIWSAQAWVMDYNMPTTNPELWVNANYGDPNHGSWRAPTYTAPNLWPIWNFGFSYDTEVDSWLERARYSNQTGKNYWLNRIAEKEQTELYPMIYVYQGKEGWVLWNDWEVNFNRGNLFFANFHFNPPPGDIALSSNAGIPDIDGNFDLIWNTSIGASNYSIYLNNNSITQINGSLTLIEAQNAVSPYKITGLSNGTYYFVVVGHNQYGETLSNNIQITVQKSHVPPISFVLNSDADFPDDDGIFDLNWTTSDGADNYSLYMHNIPFTVIDSNHTLLVDQIAISPYSVSGLSNGEYYFVVVAHNQYGDTLSNNFFVYVSIPGESTTPAISGYNTLVILGITIFTAFILFKRKKIKSK